MVAIGPFIRRNSLGGASISDHDCQPIIGAGRRLCDRLGSALVAW